MVNPENPDNQGNRDSQEDRGPLDPPAPPGLPECQAPTAMQESPEQVHVVPRVLQDPQVLQVSQVWVCLAPGEKEGNLEDTWAPPKHISLDTLDRLGLPDLLGLLELPAHLGRKDRRVAKEQGDIKGNQAPLVLQGVQGVQAAAMQTQHESFRGLQGLQDPPARWDQGDQWVLLGRKDLKVMPGYQVLLEYQGLQEARFQAPEAYRDPLAHPGPLDPRGGMGEVGQISVSTWQSTSRVTQSGSP